MMRKQQRTTMMGPREDALEDFNIKRDQAAFAEQDMFLLENQLPYPLLMLLMSSSNNHEGLKRSIKIFVDMRGVT
ncbi:unnamed protein product [Malus baccata var. baccata]|uniref:Uncharacterized protein n=1 Tax=Malus domestica TaxID=3750 RepID=A0A498I4F2_MALDO|nr:hypothetical protein DVH24_019695 [Malus domestica]